MAKRTRTPRPPVNRYAITQDGPLHDEKREFARRLQRAMAAKNWSQSELARRANALLPTALPGQKQGRDFRRDLVSHYVTGKNLPTATNLAVLAKALGVAPSELLPPAVGAGGIAPAPFSMVKLPRGRVDIHVNRTVSDETAQKIWKLLQAEDQLDAS